MAEKLKKLSALIIVVGLIMVGVSYFGAKYNDLASKDAADDVKEKIEEIKENSEAYDNADSDSGSDDGNTTNRQYENNVDAKELYKAVKEYDEALLDNQRRILTSEEVYQYACLDLTQYGIYDNTIGYISIPAIEMDLPIYLGANDSTLAYGAGHLNATTLPLNNEESGNMVLAGHTGYWGRTLFNNLSDLSEGDKVYITTYVSNCVYEVTDISVIETDDVDDLFVTKGESKLTLLTCHNGGSDRIKVSCSATQNAQGTN